MSKTRTDLNTAVNGSGRVYFIDASGGRILSTNPDGADLKVLVTDRHRIPDGIVVDVKAGYIYWTEMGIPSAEDGSIERADLDGSNHVTVVPNGKTFTPKQLQLDKRNGKLYWCDREGMRVMRSNLDGSQIETLVQTGQGEDDRSELTRWCVGIAIDTEDDKLYWTQKGPDNAGLGRIFRAGLEIPKGETPSSRSDIELMFDRLPEPIDLDLDLKHRVLYWTDRGDPPRGNTVNRAPLDAAPLSIEPEIVYTHLMEGIGLALDVAGDRMFMADLGGSLYSASLDGSKHKTLLAAQGNLTGVAYVD
ncbi:3-hydroxyacyl-CoA dehydrogenase [Terriglobus albidus]|uniref:3-hydroxyacyl-CoA dehydrogenase n=1 Tax=Terriglobus albidus TaxID=1592106 RepID=A0A5B9E9S5_9BACT|nr:3-hydroxyacyl-CoA dehydrogenase [Terriglobus albidus]QEE28888.1 3-hydroxyacyl-CoA dehydrogenase [Terriglobus albidus]